MRDQLLKSPEGQGHCNLTCPQFIELLHLVLDGEANNAERALFDAHANCCQGCLELYAKEKNLLQLIKAKLLKQPVPNGLAESIMLQVQNL